MSDITIAANSHIFNARKSVWADLSDDVRYACRFLAEHISSSPPNSEKVYGYLASFLRKDALDWLGLLEYMELSGYSENYLRQIRKWINVSATSQYIR